MIVNSYSLILLVAAALAALIALGALRRRSVPGSTDLAILMTAASLWAVCYSAELALIEPTHKIWAAKLSYLGITVVPLAWCIFAIGYSGHHRWLTRTRRTIASLLPLPTLVLVWTNEHHGLIWSRLWLVDWAGLSILQNSYGAWFWVHAASAYLALLAGTILIIGTFRRSSAEYRRQSLPLLVGVLAPWFANGLTLSSIQPLPYLDMTPLAFTITGTTFAWCLFRSDLFDFLPALVPTAREAIVESMTDAVLVIDHQNRIVDLNTAAAQLLGQPVAAIRRQPAASILLAWPAAVVATPLRPGQPLELMMCLDQTGEERCYDVLISPIELQGGQTSGRLVIAREVTERMRSQLALRQSEERYRELVENANDVIFTCDPSGHFTSLNRAGERLFGYSQAEFVKLTVVDILASEHHERIKEMLEQRVSERVLIEDIEVIARDGRRIALEVSSRLTLQGDRPRSVQGIARDVTERRQWQTTLTYQALHDSLTGLPNRTLLHERLQQALLQARDGQQPLALLLIDLDRFKEVNDTFGHHDGDALLRQIGPRLEALLNEADTVARLGGDEFAVVLTETDADEAEEIATALLAQIRTPFPIDGRLHDIGASIGIALYPDHGTDTVTLLRRADIAMYVAKRGQLGWTRYAPEQEQHSLSRLALIDELRQAIQQGQLRLSFLPQVDASSATIISLEALVRWQHPQRGLLGPAEFVPLAEEVGLSRVLDEWVLGAALHACGQWQAAGQPVGVAINLSAQQLHDPSLPETLARLLTTYAVTAGAVTLEITERALMGAHDQLRAILQRLRLVGVRVSIDDFGTGYSSLSSLQRLPISELKIDRGFVAAMQRDDGDAAIVRSAIGLGRELGLAVVAEGVEDVAIGQQLGRLGCDILQGYGLYQPVPAAEISAWLVSRAAQRPDHLTRVQPPPAAA